MKSPAELARSRRVMRVLRGQSVPQRWYWETNGSDEFLADTTALTLGIANQWTLAALLRADAITGFKYVCEFKGATDANRIIMRFDGASDRFNVLIWNSAGTAIVNLRYVASTVVAGVPFHAILTFDGTLGSNPATLYVNGSAATIDFGTNNPGTLTDTARAAYVCGSSALGNSWNGALQDLMLFPDVLDAGERAQLLTQVRSFSPVGDLGAVVHFNPKFETDMGSNLVSGGAAFDIMDDQSNISAADDRIQGTLL